ncbi:TadG family pilus assembly protein [Crenobacter sp. SG2303]|uniref:TadG family pilus assembly protein n=1 Tax=Crenobacter oryzisoli TaxID=3056844 RepID=A0ABT7XTQ1_9NEIS|nr:TadG family pilus assembly protein [Crenobacter sp. SG2303]
MAVMAVIWLSVAIILLGSIDIGSVFMQRRELQRTADMAALAGVQLMDSSCSVPTTNAKANTQQHGFGAQAGDQIAVTCGRWDPSMYAAPTYFSAQNGASSNAVQVHLQRSVPFFFAFGSRVITADATAKVTNTDSFTLGTGLVSLNAGLLNSLLSALVGGSINLDLVSYNGLANARINLTSLMAQLNAGSIQDLLATNISVQDFTLAMAKVLSQTDMTYVGALQSLALSIPKGLTVNLGNTSAVPGVLQVDASNPNAALNASIGVLDAVMVAAEVAQAGKAPITLDAGLVNLSPLASVTVKAKIIQPPVLAAGEPGLDANGVPRTSAHAAQVRLFLGIQLLSAGPSVGGFSFSALNIPLALEAGQGTAWLQSIQCTTDPKTSMATINVQPGIAAACIGDDAQASLTNNTIKLSCNQPATITSVLGLITVQAKSSTGQGLNLSIDSGSPDLLSFNAVVGDADDYQTANSNNVGQVLSNVTNQLLSSVLSSLHLNLLFVDVLGLTNGLLALLTPLLQALLAPVFNLLSTALVPLLQLLGVQLGYSTVHNLSLTCGQGQLVY